MMVVQSISSPHPALQVWLPSLYACLCIFKINVLVQRSAAYGPLARSYL